MVLDSGSLNLTSIVLAAMLGAMALLFAWQRPETRGLTAWAVAMLTGCVGLVFYGLRDALPEILPGLIANTVIACAVVLAIRSLRLLRGRNPADPLSWGLVAVQAALLLSLPGADAQQRAAAVVVSFVLAVLFARAALVLRRDVPVECRRSFGFSEALYWAASLTCAARGVGALLDPAEQLISVAYSNALLLLFYIVMMVAASLGLLWMEIELQQRDLVKLATRDTLTGILNRRALLEEFSRELSRAERQASVLSLAIFDIDRFKDFNDRFGHPVGDRVLRSVVDTMRRNIRRHDWIGRYGGEEFAVLMPGADSSVAMRIADRIRAGVEKKGFELAGERVLLTVSGGVASYPLNGRDWNALLSAADNALYKAKGEGRNRVLPAAGLTPALGKRDKGEKRSRARA
jgi:diguanylate cyclase (GGDEF)-like protein